VSGRSRGDQALLQGTEQRFWTRIDKSAELVNGTVFAMAPTMEARLCQR